MVTKRVLISIDAGLLARIDQSRARIGITRSAYIAQLAEKDLRAASGPGTTPTARAALVALDSLLREPPA